MADEPNSAYIRRSRAFVFSILCQGEILIEEQEASDFLDRLSVLFITDKRFILVRAAVSMDRFFISIPHTEIESVDRFYSERSLRQWMIGLNLARGSVVRQIECGVLGKNAALRSAFLTELVNAHASQAIASSSHQELPLLTVSPSAVHTIRLAGDAAWVWINKDRKLVVRTTRPADIAFESAALESGVGRVNLSVGVSFFSRLKLDTSFRRLRATTGIAKHN